MTLEHQVSTNRHIKLGAPEGASIIRVLDGMLTVDAVKSLVDASDKPTSVITLTRTGNFSHPRYGDFSITGEMLLSFVRNFENNVFGQDIAIDVAHAPEDGAAGYVRKLLVDGNKLRALVEWENFGVDAIKNRGYRYLSAEYHENYKDHETGKFHGPTLLGAGLVVRPHIKHLDRVELAEASLDSCPTLLSEGLHKKLASEIKIMWKALIEALQAYCKEVKLSEGVSQNLITLAEGQKDILTEKEAASAFVDKLKDTAKKLAEANATSANITLQSAGISKDDVIALIAAQQADEAKKLAEKQEQRGKVVKVLTDAVNAVEAFDDAMKTKLIDSGKKLLGEAATEDNAKALAEHLIANGEQEVSLRKLGGLGMSTPVGRVHVDQTVETSVKKLQGIVHENLRRSPQFNSGELKLKEKVSPFVEKVLSEFDRQHAATIDHEVKVLAGESLVNDSTLPVAFQREVIREALSDLNVLELIATRTDPSATATTQVPYEERDTSLVRNDGIVFENQPIPKVKASVKTDLAYINAMKIALQVSNEALHFTRAAAINWDAWSANMATASRTIKEMLHRRIANHIQRMSDRYLAMDVSNEDIAADLDGTNSIIKTAEWPIVAPFQQYDMQGNAINSEQNPITIMFGATPVEPWDGSGDQAAGTYYMVANHNLGYVAFVDESGAPVTPDEATATISYSYATNVLHVDADVPGGVSLEKHLNTLLRGVGSRKAMMKDDRFVTPDFLLMSNTLNDTATNAEDFTASYRRRGNEDNAMGDLEAIKGINSWETNAPGVHLGDQRIQVGRRGSTTLTIAKAFTLSEIQEARNADGQLIGAKEVYGEEYNSVHTPSPIADRYTSVLHYSFTNR